MYWSDGGDILIIGERSAGGWVEVFLSRLHRVDAQEQRIRRK